MKTRSTHSGVPLTVTATERAGDGSVTHLHGVYRGGRPWRLSMQDALAAVQAGHYIMSLRHGPTRVRLGIAGRPEPRLEARSRTGEDLLLTLPQVEIGQAA
jgi:hypothetical protein